MSVTVPSPSELRQLAEAKETMSSEGGPMPRLLMAPVPAREPVASPNAYHAAAARTAFLRSFKGIPSIRIRRRLRRTVER